MKPYRKQTATASTSASRSVRTAVRTAVFIQRDFDRSVVTDAFRHLQPQVAADQGRRFVDLHVVQVGALLPADLQQIAEPVGGDQAGPGAAMLDQRVGRDGRAVAEIGDRGGRGADTPDTLRDAVGNALGWVVGGGRTFQTATAPVSSSNRQTSVKVPPESTPMRHAMSSGFPK